MPGLVFCFIFDSYPSSEYKQRLAIGIVTDFPNLKSTYPGRSYVSEAADFLSGESAHVFLIDFLMRLRVKSLILLHMTFRFSGEFFRPKDRRRVLDSPSENRPEEDRRPISEKARPETWLSEKTSNHQNIKNRRQIGRENSRGK